jgi:hypothetical protein
MSKWCEVGVEFDDCERLQKLIITSYNINNAEANIYDLVKIPVNRSVGTTVRDTVWGNLNE